jgi:hypothetical protein
VDVPGPCRYVGKNNEKILGMTGAENYGMVKYETVTSNKNPDPR